MDIGGRIPPFLDLPLRRLLEGSAVNTTRMAATAM